VGGTPVRTRAYGSYYDSAAGDFCLLPSVVFHSIRGFAEIPNNIFMDGTAIHAAAAHGYGQQVFKPPCSIYHQVNVLCAAWFFIVIVVIVVRRTREASTPKARCLPSPDIKSSHKSCWSKERRQTSTTTDWRQKSVTGRSSMTRRGDCWVGLLIQIMGAANDVDALVTGVELEEEELSPALQGGPRQEL
jgi:hypothetical protein